MEMKDGKQKALDGIETAKKNNPDMAGKPVLNHVLKLKETKVYNDLDLEIHICVECSEYPDKGCGITFFSPKEKNSPIRTINHESSIGDFV